MGLVKAYNGDKPYIFISYSHKDTDIVLKMVSQLQADGFRVWYDEGIKPGTEWDDYIASKINECSYFLAFLSENYLNSSNCKDEMNYARDHVDNILLVYLESVTLPSGMEMRFGRNQAIFAYKYEVKSDFFNKLYLSKDISLCKGDSTSNIVEESVDDIPNESFADASDAMPQTVKTVEIEEVKETSFSDINVERVPAKDSKFGNKKLMWIIIAVATVLILAVVIVGIVLVNSSKSKKTNSHKQSKTEREIDEDDDSDEDFEEDTDDESDEDLDEDLTEDDITVDDSINEGDGFIPGVYSSYNLDVGGVYYSHSNMDFYVSTGLPTFYDSERDEETNGEYSGVFAMSVQIPALPEYGELLHIQWYYVDDDGFESLVADFYDIYPLSDEGEKWYDLFLSALDLGGEIPSGDYYVVVFPGDDVEESLVIRLKYS